MVEATRKEQMSYSKEELLKWQEFYKQRVNDESFSDQQRMHAFSRLTDIAAALKEIEEEENQPSFLDKYLKGYDCVYNQRDYE